MTEKRTTSSTGGQKGVKLERHDLIPAGPLKALAEHFGIGALKYDSHQWRQGYELSKSYAAMIRHATEWLAGRSYDVCSNDPKGCSHVDLEGNPFKSPREDACFNHTGSHHMAAVAWHAFAIQETEAEFPEHDDRFKREVNGGHDVPPKPLMMGEKPGRPHPQSGVTIHFDPNPTPPNSFSTDAIIRRQLNAAFDRSKINKI